MKVLLLKSTKYKGKMLRPGTHDVTQAKAKEWKKLGIAEEVKEEEKKKTDKNPKEKTQAEIMEEGLLSQLQEEAKALGIETEGKDFEALKAEVEGFGE